MKTHILYSLFISTVIIIICLFIISCEDVIKLNLQNSGPKIVIESVISDNGNIIEVKISKSQNFYSQDDYEKIDNAIVILSDKKGFSDTLKNIGNGLYKSGILDIKNGYTYKLAVTYNDITYQAINTMPNKTELESLNYEWIEYPHTNGYLVNLYFTDNPEIKNYYRIRVRVSNKEYRNEKVGLEYLLYDDKVFNGLKTKLPALRGSRLLEEGDTVTIELYSLSKETYDYYYTIQNIMIDDPSLLGKGKNMIEGLPTPANPITNFNNGALGFFGAYCVSHKTIIIKP